MSSDALLILALVPAFLWGPIAVFFFKNWQRRKNPISMASCVSSLGGCYLATLLFISIGVLSKETIVLGITILSSATALNFHWSIRAAEKFHDARKDLVP